MKRIITDEIRQGVIDNYVNKQWGQIKSGKPYGVGQKSVNKILKEANIPIRTLQEANALHRDKMKMPFNEDYFDIETPNMAYILGLIASDGNINRDRNCISIKLNSTDKEILERIRQELDMVRPIRDYITNSGQAFSDLSMSSIKVKKLLKEQINADIVIDLHRDAIGDYSYAPTVRIGEEEASQLMFVIGTDGGGLEHQNWNQNLKFAIKVQEKANELYPGLFKPIILRNSRYNQHLAKGACIIEVGATGNTMEQCLNSMKYLAKVVNEVIEE